MFKPPFGLYCPLFRSSSYPAPMTPESRTDFSSNQSKNPFFWPGCVACVARSRHPSVARSRSPSSPPRSLPSPQSRDRPFATQHRPPPEVARSIDRRVAVLSPIAASRALPPETFQMIRRRASLSHDSTSGGGEVASAAKPAVRASCSRLAESSSVMARRSSAGHAPASAVVRGCATVRYHPCATRNS